MPLSEFEKRVYNNFLSSYKKNKKEPFKYRKNFDTFEEDEPEKTVFLRKVSDLLLNYKNINPSLFFDAPYHFFKNGGYFDLKFYSEYKAIKVYLNYLKEIEAMSPDSDVQLRYIVDSLNFIRDYCIEKNISLPMYLDYKDGIIYAWLNHLLTHKISFYVFIGFEKFNSALIDYLYNMPVDEIEYFAKDYIDKYNLYKMKIKDSKIAKNLISTGLDKVKKSLESNLNKQENVVN